MLFVGITSNWVICPSVFGCRSSERPPLGRGKTRISKKSVLTDMKASGFVESGAGIKKKTAPHFEAVSRFFVSVLSVSVGFGSKARAN